MFRRDLLCSAVGLGLSAAVPFQQARAASGPAAPTYQWANVTFGGGGYVSGLCFHPRERGLLYARLDMGGLYRHDAASAQWVPLLDGLSWADGELMSVLSVALDPDDPERVYALCGGNVQEWARKGALLSSTDRGRSWAIRDLGVWLGGAEPGCGTGERLQVDPHQPALLLLGTSQDGLMRSVDRGQSFKPLGFGPRHVSLVLLDPSSAAPDSGCRRMWVGSQDKPGLYVSEDGGLSFNRVPGLPEQVPQHAVMARDRTLYVTFALGQAGQPVNPANALTGSVWRRDRNGQWRDITPMQPGGGVSPPFGYSGLDVDPRAPNRVVVSTVNRWNPGEEMFMSTDSGQTWEPLVNRSFHNLSTHPWLADQTARSGRLGWWISDLKIDPFDSARLVYGTGYGVWETRNLDLAQKDDNPVRWTFSVRGMETTSATEIRSPSGGATLLAAMGGVVGGGAWDRLDVAPKLGLFTPLGEGSVSVDFAEAAPAIIARTCQSGEGGRISVDGGASWRPFAAPVQGKAQHPRGGRIAVSAKGGFMVWVPFDGNALCSRDRGKTWDPCAGWPQRRDTELVPVADRTVEGVFYVYERTRGRILQSLDGGQHFDTAITRLPELHKWQGTQLVSAPGALRDLWLALPDGLLHLPGPEQPTRSIDLVLEARLVCLGKAAPGADYHTLYVWGRVMQSGTEMAGLFRSTDRGASFVRIDDDAHRYGHLLSLCADPLEFGTVFVAPKGRGIVAGRPRVGA